MCNKYYKCYWLCHNMYVFYSPYNSSLREILLFIIILFFCDKDWHKGFLYAIQVFYCQAITQSIFPYKDHNIEEALELEVGSAWHKQNVTLPFMP